MVVHCFRDRAEDDADFRQLLLVGGSDTESKITSTATPASLARSFIGTPSFSKVRSSSGSTSSRLASFFGLGAE
jgi:hypothetical protein